MDEPLFPFWTTVSLQLDMPMDHDRASDVGTHLMSSLIGDDSVDAPLVSYLGTGEFNVGLLLDAPSMEAAKVRAVEIMSPAFTAVLGPELPELVATAERELLAG